VNVGRFMVSMCAKTSALPMNSALVAQSFTLPYRRLSVCKPRVLSRSCSGCTRECEDPSQ
jgi:hypothetical protein